MNPNFYCVRCRTDTKNIGRPRIIHSTGDRVTLEARRDRCKNLKSQFTSKKKLGL